MDSRSQSAFYHVAWHKVFYEHYRIGGTGESPCSENEPKSKGELTTEYVGSHSPFGIIWQIAVATGWSQNHIMWKVNYQTLRMMLADAPHYENRRKSEGRREKGKRPKSTAGFFQTKLQQNQ